jgi:RNA-binding protein YhbY
MNKTEMDEKVKEEIEKYKAYLESGKNHMERTINSIPIEDCIAEMELIKFKQSKLSRSQRDMVIKRVQKENKL